jgi:hypothetical protein
MSPEIFSVGSEARASALFHSLSNRSLIMNQKYDQNHIENDTFIEMFYFPKADKSQTKGMERQRNKNRPTWKQLSTKFNLDDACAKYEQALSRKGY